MEKKTVEKGTPAYISSRYDLVSGTIRLAIHQNSPPDWPRQGYILTKEQAQSLMQ